jgi:hypothetical protein
VDHNLYSSLVIRAVPRNLELVPVTKKGWRRGPSPVGRVLRSNSQPSSRDSNPLLDSLFSMHAVGSTPADALLRDTFYKVAPSLSCPPPTSLTSPQSLLLSGRPETVIHYEAIRQSFGLHLTSLSHSRVLEAHASLLDGQGIMASLHEWINESRPIGVPTRRCEGLPELQRKNASVPMRVVPKARLGSLHSQRSKQQIVTRPPDGRGYALLVNFFSAHPHLLTKAMLADLFENIQIDKVLLSETRVLKLFHLTNRLKAPALANEMLLWFCDSTDGSATSPSPFSHSPASQLRRELS